jgi:hypothetical protein
MFLHGGWAHILGNVAVPGDLRQGRRDAFGPLRYLVFYFGGGFAAMMTQTAMTMRFGTAQDRIPAWILLGGRFLYQLIEADFGLFNARANGGRRVLRPRRRVHLRPAGSTAPRPGGTGGGRRWRCQAVPHQV